jgi:hypothetical protein
MGRIKDLVIELQNEFGYNMEFLPEDFNMDEYLAKRAQEVEVKPLPLSSVDRDTLNFATKVTYEPLFCDKVKSKNK